MKIEVNTDILFYAFRYALGRRTYAVNDVVTVIAEYINILPGTDLYLMHEEIGEAIRTGNAGMDMDVREWNDLQYEIGKELSSRGFYA